jgi:hypothetical protein
MANNRILPVEGESWDHYQERVHEDCTRRYEALLENVRQNYLEIQEYKRRQREKPTYLQ